MTGQEREPDWDVEPPVLAAIAARAASRVVGVQRLQSGLVGLTGAAIRAVRQRIADVDPAPTEGVRIEVDDTTGSVDVEIDLTISHFEQAAAVARAVQHAVHRTVTDATGIAPRNVSVNILDADPGTAV
ncbi:MULTISPECIES: Asp23/Gls24 family envelope stress response protein [Prauserella salsuginis group]|uniref:Asp23/Gls24 family envelope stress response protein n=1 Tax=Prauserella salsuginis TaxID=387889 RepID=A0ABW6FYJ0_9PSEU|nr:MULTISPECIES: Asp23/Gls24 family envelope stress response protein [Prauserella salsuginis group]MCR3720997.1 putative conserved protein YloU, alkaline shock protein (Asp23) family [Prauserella flava]MCR3734922.1 putative conserved protein YloU, alkaline shock protein (Asp23) family [Prauserella salsuginis]